MFLFTKFGNCIKNEWHEHLTSLTFSFKVEVTIVPMWPESIGIFIFKFDPSTLVKEGIGREVDSLSRSRSLIAVFMFHLSCPNGIKHSGKCSPLSWDDKALKID